MPYYRVKLKPKGPFFKGINSHARKSTAIVHSDVLHSAFLCVAHTLDPYWLEEDRAKTLLVSSIYPYYEASHNDKNAKQNDKERNILYLYPKPFSPYTDDKEKHESTADTEKEHDRKKWKKVKYVSERLFVKLLTDKNAEKEEYMYLDEEKGITLFLKEEKVDKKPSKKIVTENYKISTVIDRGTNQATPYPQNFYEINTEEGVGLWFLVKLEESEVDSFKKVLSALGSLGIGGERSSGFGHFSVKNIIPFESDNIKYSKDKDILVVNGHETLKHNAVSTLSLYHPTKEEFEVGILKGIASYECTMRGGWIHGLAGDSFPKMSVRMCIEGSIFPVKEGIIPKGNVIDISYNEKPHKIWRSGLAFNIYFHYLQNEENKK